MSCSGRTIRLFREELESLSESPISTEANVLFVAYYASAEIGCYRSLGWPLPQRVLDLYAEFRCLTSGLGSANGFGLLGAMCHYGLPSIEAYEKESMRQLAMRDGLYTEDERRALLDYCQSDVMALAQLLPTMLTKINLGHALLRGRYMIAAACMEATGIPIDTVTFQALRDNWGAIQQQLIDQIDEEYGVFDGLTFKAARFQNYLARHNIAWPQTDAGSPKLDDDTFSDMAKCHPGLSNLKQLRKSLAEMRKLSLTVGSDGRNRCLLSVFGSKTGRNQPSNSKFVFGASAWFRGLIKPKRGRAIAYLDWEQQEWGIAAALSNDSAMMAAYASGDPYLEFAKQAGAAPSDATKHSHSTIREQFKVCALAVQYGMTEQSLAMKLDVPVARARQLKEHPLQILAHNLSGQNREAIAGSDPVAAYFELWGRRLYRCVSSRVVPVAIMKLIRQFPSIEFQGWLNGAKAFDEPITQVLPTREEMRNRRQLLMLQIIAEVEELQHEGLDPFVD